jgi:hypothetical protein
VLLKSDFAIAPSRDPNPTDKIGKYTWNHIFTLPDDVAVRTTNHNGKAIKQISDLTYEWLLHCDGEDPIMGPVMLDAHDDFDAALYTAIVGYYRLSNSAMRSALELVTIGAWAQVCNRKKEFRKWQRGKIELSLGRACDELVGATSALNDQLRMKVNDNLFDQRSPTSKAGSVRRIFGAISDFSHSRPGFTDFSMRQSNGPIYREDAFKHSMRLQTEILAFLFILLLIAKPGTRFDPIVASLFADAKRVKSRVARATFKILHS